MKKRSLLVALACSALLVSAYWFVPSIAAELRPMLEVLRVTPSGDEIVDLRQIVFEFNRNVVPLGEMKREASQIPIEIRPEVKCEWHWLNATTLSCNLDEKNALSMATRYQITVKPGLVALDKATMSRAFRHEFSTQRPAISETSVQSWKAPGHPVIRVTTNQQVTAQSLKSVLRFVNRKDAKGAGDLKITEVEALDWQGQIDPSLLHRRWDIEPATDFAAGREIDLKVVPGLSSLSGPLKGTEKKTLLAFDAFEEFAFVGIECATLADVTVRNPNEKCDPTGFAYLLFNAPVARRDVMAILQSAPDFSDNDDYSTDNDYELRYQLSQNHKKGDVYKIQLPNLSPSKTYTLGMRTDVGSILKDVFGRPIANKISSLLLTDHLRPNFNLPYRYAVLELGTQSDVLAQVTNLKSWTFNYQGFTASKDLRAQSLKQPLESALDVRAVFPLNIRQHLSGESGVFFGEFVTDPSIGEYTHTLFAEVTPYQIHAKVGHFNTLVWVTDLASGKVVPAAKVTLYKDTFRNLSKTPEAIATQTTDEAGIAILPGASVFDPKLDLYHNQWDDKKDHIFVRVDKEQHMALLPLVSDFEASTWRASNGAVNEFAREKNQHVVTWGTTPQGIYRLGDKIQYKIYVRNQNNETLTAAPKDGYTLQVTDPTGKLIHERSKITLSKFGGIDGEFTVSKQGSVGWYDFHIVAADEISYNPMRVLVSDFTPAPFKVSQDLNGDAFGPEQKVMVTTRAKLHSGGSYSDAAARVTALVERTWFEPQTPSTKGFYFSSGEGNNVTEVFQGAGTLDKSGELKSEFTLPELPVYYGKLKVESAVQDDRGKNIAAHDQAQYLGVDRFVGVKTKEWMTSTSKPLDVLCIVVDSKGNPVSGTEASLTLQKQENNIARIKDVGAAYSTHMTTTWVDKDACQGTSSQTPLECRFNPDVAGSYRLIATIKDSKGREHVTEYHTWVSGKEPIIWDEDNENFLEIVPEKPTGVVGEKMRFLVKNPYPNAKALITIERYGVIDRFVKTLDTSSAVIEIPIKPDYLPGFYFSVTIQSPRVAKPPKPGQVDLGKPTFSMGYVSVPVVDRYKEIAVKAKADREIYRPRDKVKVTLKAQPKAKSAKKEPIELAVAVVDEAVFDLLSGGNQNYDPYRGLYQFEALDLINYSLLTRLVTRQALETKGANPGGDGGVDVGARSIFKYVSYWNPSIITDADGNASVEFEAPDNLTGWRVLAMAVTPTDRAGLGVAQFKVNQPTEIRPAMPNQVVEGDNFNASFTVMNRTQKPRTVKVEIKASGNIEATKDYAQTVAIEPFQRVTVSMPVKVQTLPMNRELEKGKIKFVIRAGDASDTDALTHSLDVEKNRTLNTAAVYGTTTEKRATVDLVYPKDIFTDKGDVEVSLSTSVLPQVDGAFRYMRDYPYSCWEQRLTKGIMANLYQQLQSYLVDGLSWPQSEQLAQETLDMANNFQAPNGGMAYFVATDDRVDPYLSAFTALGFDWLRQDGKAVPVTVEKKLHDYLFNFLRHDAAPSYYSAGMVASVRATVLYALAQQGKVTITELKRLEPQFGAMNLFGQAHFVQAALATKGAEKIAQDLVKKMLGRSTQTSGKFLFSDANENSFSRILSSSLRSNCAALDMLVTAAKKEGLDKVNDIPMKLVRSIAETRNGRDHFENTQENLFCMHALANYSKVYESEIPNLKTRVLIDDALLGSASFTKRTSPPVAVSKPIQKNDPGRNAKVNIEREGLGRLYYATTVRTAPLKGGTRMNAGLELRREYSVLRANKWVPQKAPLQFQRGDLVRVDLYLSVPRASNFVVINDPIPGAFEPVNRDLATASTVDAQSETTPYEFYHRELLNDVARFYSDYVEAGSYHLSYTAQVVADGQFLAMAPMAQEMYNPEVLGRDSEVLVTVNKL